MEWQHLEYFRVVARTQHVTKAAEQLAITQPALSRSITKLEEEVGVALFDRVGRSVQLNRYGSLFLQHVERALQEVHNGIQEIRELHDPHTGTVALAFLLTFGLNILPDVISKFNRKYPNVEFLLYQNPTTIILNQLLQGEVDLCIVGPLDNRRVIWQKLIEEELYVYVPAGHRLAGETAVRLEELADEPFISFKKGYGMRSLTDTFCEQAGFAPRIKFEGDDVATTAGLVSSGLGVSLMPAFSGIDSGKIRQLRVIEPHCRRAIGMAWVKDRTLSPSAELFRQFMIEQLSLGKELQA